VLRFIRKYAIAVSAALFAATPHASLAEEMPVGELVSVEGSVADFDVPDTPPEPVLAPIEETGNQPEEHNLGNLAHAEPEVQPAEPEPGQAETVPGQIQSVPDRDDAGIEVERLPAEVKQHTVRFLGKDGEEVSVASTQSGGAVAQPQPPAYDGWTFVRWSEETNDIWWDINVRAVYSRNGEMPEGNVSFSEHGTGVPYGDFPGDSLIHLYPDTASVEYNTAKYRPGLGFYIELTADPGIEGGQFVLLHVPGAIDRGFGMLVCHTGKLGADKWYVRGTALDSVWWDGTEVPCPFRDIGTDNGIYSSPEQDAQAELAASLDGFETMENIDTSEMEAKDSQFSEGDYGFNDPVIYIAVGLVLFGIAAIAFEYRVAARKQDQTEEEQYKKEIARIVKSFKGDDF
jgi:hypothetical protein